MKGAYPYAKNRQALILKACRVCGGDSWPRTNDPIGVDDVRYYIVGCTFTITESLKRFTWCFSANLLIVLLNGGSFFLLLDKSKG